MASGPSITPSSTTRRPWLWPTIGAIILFLGGVASNLVATHLDWLRTSPLQWVIWVAFGGAAVTAVIIALRERPQQADATQHGAPGTPEYQVPPGHGLSPDQHLHFLTSQTLIGHQAEHTRLRTLHDRIIPEHQGHIVF